MNNSGKVFEKLIHLATDKGIIVQFAPLQAYNGRLRGNKLLIRQDLPRIEDFNYILAHELAHVYLHYDKGDTINSDMHTAYEEQADRAAMLLLDVLGEENGKGCIMERLPVKETRGNQVIYPETAKER